MTQAPQQPLLVVIDGPAGAGKSTVARRLARALHVVMLDTGAIYRTLAWAAAQAGIDWGDETGLVSIANGFPISFVEGQAPDTVDAVQRVHYDGQDVTTTIRTAEMTTGASEVSGHPKVREALLGIQRALGAHGCVAEGRDMGTVVFPHARHKFFLTADVRTRAERRRNEWLARGDGSSPGSLDDIAADIEARDRRDSTRATAPLARAPDAVVVDTSGLDPDEVVRLLAQRVRDRG